MITDVSDLYAHLQLITCCCGRFYYVSCFFNYVFLPKIAAILKNKAQILKTVRVYGTITLGLFLHALGWTAFLIPGEIVSGGIGGVSAIIFYAFDIPMGYTYLGVNAVLILFAIKGLGANFGVKTIYSVTMVAIFLNLQQRFITEPIVLEGFMSTVLGGALAGAGVGLVLSQGGSTGGTDIIAMLINKYRSVSPGKIILYCDIVIIGSSYFLFKSIESLVYGFVTIAVVGYTIDLILNGFKQSMQIMIISKEWEQIADIINTRIDRGVTVIHGQGWYSKNETQILMTIVRRSEAQRINRIVKEIDPEAFISQGAVVGAYGKGFDEIRG